MRWLVVVFITGCLPVPVYRVQRTARVPHPAAPLRTGEPIDGPVELSFGASNAFDLRSPRLVDHDASVEVPGTQVRGELRVRLPVNLEVDLIHDRALDDSIKPLDKTQAPVKDGSIYSIGGAVRYSLQLDQLPGWSLGFGLELLQWTIPYVEYRSCVENCEGVPQQEMTKGTDTLATLGTSITPTYRIGDIALFGGIYAAPHPTIVRKGTEYSATDYNSELEMGTYNFIAHAGVEYRLGPVSWLAQIQYDLTPAPVSYGPSFGFAMAVHLPDGYLPAPKRVLAGIWPDPAPADPNY